MVRGTNKIISYKLTGGGLVEYKSLHIDNNKVIKDYEIASFNTSDFS